MTDTLNPEQRAAVHYTDGPLLVLAGAGSGKTRVITRKIAYLIRERGFAARTIAAVTFTNKAAREMQQRVSQLLPGREARGLRVSTFHTLGLDILRRESSTLGYQRGFSIYDAKDSLRLLQELAKQDDATAVQSLQWRISRWKSALLTPEEALAEGGDELQAAAAQLYARYERQLKAYNAVDFDDLIRLPIRLFQAHPQRLDAWQARIRYLLVDEYQDTNAGQYQLVKALVGLRGGLTVVGDDDQSIYAWRGAQPQNLHLLQEDYPQLKIIKLEQNYRSMQRILKVANQLIRNNPHVFPKTLWSALGHGDLLRVIVCQHEQHEAERVIGELLHHRFKHGARYRDYAILYRSNHQSQLFERVLREHRIPYRISGGTSFFDHTEVKDILAYLRLLANPADDAAFLRIVNTPRREIGPASLEKLSEYAKHRGTSLAIAAGELGLNQSLGERACKRLQAFSRLLEESSEQARRGDPVAAIRALVATIRYEDWLQDNSSSAKTAARRMSHVNELLDWLSGLAADPEQDYSVGDLVARMSLLDILDRKEDEDQSDALALLTLHAAKGLEFPHVFLVGMEEELLPHRNSIGPEAIEEERRLAYVGITRAQRSLVFTLTERRKRYGEWQICEPSRFLAELPQQELQWEGGKREAAPELRQQRGRTHLDVLKGMLAGKA